MCVSWHSLLLGVWTLLSVLNRLTSDDNITLFIYYVRAEIMAEKIERDPLWTPSGPPLTGPHMLVL